MNCTSIRIRFLNKQYAYCELFVAKQARWLLSKILLQTVSTYTWFREYSKRFFYKKKIAISHSKVHCRYFSKYFHMKEALQFSLQFHRCIKCDISRMGSNYVVSDQKKNNTQNLYHKIFLSFLLFIFIGLFHLVQISIPKLIWTLWESPMYSFVHWSRTINSNRLT